MKLKLDQNLRDMFNYLIKIEYDGSKFVGWQYQKNGKSIQEKIEKALFKFLKRKLELLELEELTRECMLSDSMPILRFQKKLKI